MNSNEFGFPDDESVDSTLTNSNNELEAPAGDETLPEEGAETITIGGKEYTLAEAEELVSKGVDYTQKRQADAEEMRDLRAKLEALEGKGAADAEPDAGGFDPESWLQSEIGDEMDATAEGVALARGLASVATEVTSEFAALRAEIAELKAELAPMREQRQNAAATAELRGLLKDAGVTTTDDIALAKALKASGGNVPKAMAAVVKSAMGQGGTPARKTPATAGSGGASLADIPVEQMTDEQFDASVLAGLRELR